MIDDTTVEKIRNECADKTKIIITINGEEKTLTMREAESLYNTLDKIFGKNKSNPYIPYTPPDIRRYEHPYPTPPLVWYC